MKKNFLKIFLAACVITFPAKAQQMDYYYNRLVTTPIPKTEDVEKKLKQQRALNAQKKEIAAAKKKCDRPVQMKLNNQIYAVPRNISLEYTRFDGIRIKEGDPDHPYQNCDMLDAGRVTKFTTGYKKATDINIDVDELKNDETDLPTTYILHKVEIDEAYNGGKMIGLADGTRKAVSGKNAIYVLPKDILKTGNGEPVVVYCNPVNLKDDAPQVKAQRSFPRACSARYKHVDGVGFAYTYLENSESDYFGLDILARKMFEDMKKPAAAPKAEKPASSQ